MREVNFLKELERRSIEQRRLMETEMISGWARGVGNWLGVNPWRVIAPISAIAYSLVRTAYGGNFREFVLGLFGGFVR